MAIYIRDKDRLRKVCVHEAGHYVVAKEMQFQTHGIGVLIYQRQGHSGSSIFEPLRTGIRNFDDLELYLKQRVQVLYAGAIAESINHGEYDSQHALDEWTKGGAMNDFAKVKELIHTLRNIKFPDTTDEALVQVQVDDLDKELIAKAGALVNNNIRLIHFIADHLERKVDDYAIEYTLTEPEISAIMNKAQ